MQIYAVKYGKNHYLRRRVSNPGGLSKDVWTSGLVHVPYLPLHVWNHNLCTYLRAQSFSVQPRASSSAKVPLQRPSPPQLDRAGDLNGRLLCDYLSGWTPQYNEYDYYVPPEAVHGVVPEDIRGTLFLIGPALTEAYGTCVRHPSDADGMVCSIAFGDGGQIFFRNRYVRTSSFVAEQAVGRRLTRGRHDRGAPIVIGRPQQQQLQQQDQTTTTANSKSSSSHHNNHSQYAQRHGHQHHHLQHTQHSHHHRDASTDKSTDASRMSVDRQKAAAMRSDFDSDNEEEAKLAGFSPLAAVAAAAVAAGKAAPSKLNWDPFALLGLPSPPPLSALFNPLDVAFRAPANASIVHWGGRLLAFTEGGSLPYELNKLTLETVGQYDVAGAMADIGRLVGSYKIAPAPSAQPQPDARVSSAGGQAQRLVLMGAAQSGPDALLRWVEVGPDGHPVGSPTTYRMRGATAMGVLDFWVTDRYYVVVQVPLDFNPQKFATEAALGMASFAECFEWATERPSRIHLVPRPSAGTSSLPSNSSSVSLAAPARSRDARVGISVGSSAPWVWPRPGPEAIVVDAAPLLPVSCVGCYSLATHGDRLLVLDALCQQGLSGSGKAALDVLDPLEHRRHPKPELTRLVVDLRSGTASARVLSQRTVSAATTPAEFLTSGNGSSGGAAAAPALAQVGHSRSSAGGYHYLYAAASASDAAEGWAPSQVVLKMTLPPDYAVPADGGEGTSTATIPDVTWSSRSDALARLRGIGTEAWSPGDRMFMGPPVYVPRRNNGVPLLDHDSGTVASARGSAAVGAGRQTPRAKGSPHCGSEDEEEGWLLVMVHDATSMTAELCVLDACDVTRGPVAVIRLPHHLPHARDAHFTPSYYGPGRTAPPGWRPRTATTVPIKGSDSKEQR